MEFSLIEFLLAIHWLLELSPVFSISFCNGVVVVHDILSVSIKCRTIYLT